MESQPAYLVPPSTVKHLGIAENAVYGEEFDCLDDAKKYMRSVPTLPK